MKRLLLTLALLMAFAASAQHLTIPGTEVQYRLNSEDWVYVRTFQHPKGGDIYLYAYTGHDVVDLEGDTVLPFLRIYVVRDYDGSTTWPTSATRPSPTRRSRSTPRAKVCPPPAVSATSAPTPTPPTRRTTSST